MSLGLVLTPYGHVPGSFPAAITKSTAGATAWAQPFDPQFYTRGEAGYFYDTPLGQPGLGNIPTDFELAKRRGYLPVMSGWVTTQQGYQTGGWKPPTGYYPGEPQAMRLPLAPRGLGEAQPATADDVMAIMAAHNDRIFALTLVSTAAVTISALIGLFRTLKLIKEGRRD